MRRSCSGPIAPRARSASSTSNLSLGGLLAGPIVFDKAFYNLSYQLGRRANDLRTLLNTDAGGLQAAGVSADSVARLLAIAAAQRIPTAVGNGLASQPAQRPGLAVRQHRLHAAGIDAPARRMSLTLNGNWNRQTPAGNLSDGAAGARRRSHQLESSARRPGTRRT